MIQGPGNRSNTASATAGHDHIALNVSNHGLSNLHGHTSACLSSSVHSCCSTATRGGNNNYGNVSLSNIFADDDERIDIFGENSMVGFITALQLEQTLNIVPVQSESTKRPKPQRHTSSMKSMRTIGTESTSTWQGSCNSFFGMDDELLDLSFTINDFDEQNDDLSLHMKNTATSGSCQVKPISRNLSQKDIALSSYKNKASPKSSKASIHGGMKRTIQPKVSSSLVVTCVGMHRCFGDESGKSGADQSPRKPIRRCDEEEEPEQENKATISRTKLINSIDISPPLCDDSSCCEEVVKINVPLPSQKYKRDESDRKDCDLLLSSDTDVPSPLPLPRSESSTQSGGEVSSKEDAAPKCPRRGTSPTPTHKKKVMMIPLKDLEKYVSDGPETNGRSQTAAITAKKYKHIMKAAEVRQLHNGIEMERVKVSMHDVSSSPYSPARSVPNSIAVFGSDRSLSSMDDSGRPSIDDIGHSPPGTVMVKRPKNSLRKSISSRSMANSPSSLSKKSGTRVVRTKPRTVAQKISTPPKTTRRIVRAVSCQALCEPSNENSNETGSTSHGKSSVVRKCMRSSSCLIGRSEQNISSLPHVSNRPPVQHPSDGITTAIHPNDRPQLVHSTIHRGEKIPTLRSFFKSKSFHHRSESPETTMAGPPGWDCHPGSDRPPMSPRRYITPTKGASFRSRSK